MKTLQSSSKIYLMRATNLLWSFLILSNEIHISVVLSSNLNFSYNKIIKVLNNSLKLELAVSAIFKLIFQHIFKAVILISLLGLKISQQLKIIQIFCIFDK